MLVEIDPMFTISEIIIIDVLVGDETSVGSKIQIDFEMEKKLQLQDHDRLSTICTVYNVQLIYLPRGLISSNIFEDSTIIDKSI